MDNKIKQSEPTVSEPIVTQETPVLPPIETPPEPTIPQETIINTEPAEIPPIETPTAEPQIETSVPSSEYQQIMDEYAAKTNTPEPTETPVVENTTRSSEEQLQSLGITVAPPKTGGAFFKMLFISSLVIFVLVLTALGIIYFKSQKTTDNSDNSTLQNTPTNSALQNGTCLLNEKTYQVGESFAAADGCNTCSCTAQDMIACTEKECLSTTPATKSATITPTKSATTSSITKDWKTYTNKDYSFSINYSNKWTINETISVTSKKTGSIVFKPINTTSSNEIFNLFINQRSGDYLNMTFEEFLNKYPGPVQNYNSQASLKKIITKDGAMGYEATYNAVDSNGKKYISLPVAYFDFKNKTGDYLEIIFENETNLDLYNQMINTFKFN